MKAGESFNSAAEILVHPNGKFVYSSNRGHDTVSVYGANPETGKLKVVQVQPIRGAFPRNINLTPDSNWLLKLPVRTPTPSLPTASNRRPEDLPTNGVRSLMSFAYLYSVHRVVIYSTTCFGICGRGRSILIVFPS